MTDVLRLQHTHTDGSKKVDGLAAIKVAIRLALVANALMVVGRAVNFNIIGLSPYDSFMGFGADFPLGKGDKNCVYSSELSEKYLRGVVVAKKGDGQLFGYLGLADSCNATFLEPLLAKK